MIKFSGVIMGEFLTLIVSIIVILSYGYDIKAFAFIGIFFFIFLALWNKIFFKKG